MSADPFAETGRWSTLSATSRLWMMMDHTMWEHYGNGNNKCDEVAKRLLVIPELPLILRASALIILSTKRDGYGVERAREAVRLIDDDVRADALNNGVPFPEGQFTEAKYFLDKALAAAEEDAKDKENSGSSSIDNAAQGREEDNGVTKPRRSSRSRALVQEASGMTLRSGNVLPSAQVTRLEYGRQPTPISSQPEQPSLPVEQTGSPTSVEKLEGDAKEPKQQGTPTTGHRGRYRDGFDGAGQ